MIKKIRLENWRSHRDSEFVFGQGTNVLVGRMGSGKSSVTDALCFALFGTFPALKGKRVGLDEVIMNKPNEMQNARVALEFDYGGKNYLVEREIRRKGNNSGKLFCGERLIAGPKTTDVSSAVENVLEMDYELFSRAVYSEQNQIDYFLRLSPLQRKEKFDELLGINRYEKVRGNAVSVLNRMKKIVLDKERWLKEQETVVDGKALVEYRKKLVKKMEIIKGLEKGVGKEKGSVEGVERELEREEEKGKKFEKLRERKVAVAARIDSMAKNISEIEKELGKKKLNDVKNEITAIEKGIAGIREKQRKLDLESEGKQRKVNEFAGKEEANKNMVREIGKILPHLKGEHANCPVCKAELSGENKERLLAENEEEIKGILRENEGLLKEIGKIKHEIDWLRKEKKDSEEEVGKKQEEKIKLNELVESASKLEKNLEGMKALELENTRVGKEIEGLGFDDAKLRKLREKVIKTKERIASLQKEIDSSMEIVKEIENSVRRIEKLQKQMEEAKEELENSKKMIDKLAVFTNSLKATQGELRQAMIETINAAMDDIWQRLYPYGDYTSAKIDVVSGNYEVVVKSRLGDWVRVEGILSGGERSAVAITLRVGISLVLAQNLGWLVLDEPTHNLDSEAVNVLSGILKEHLPELVEQIFIITHDKQMENAATASLYVLEREKESDAATKVFSELKIS